MIARLGIRRFKGFKAVDLELGQLTVLTGLNSAGKTSTVQALLLLRQALRGDAVVALNGPDGLALGEPLDVLHRGSGAETIELTLETTGPTEPSRVVLALPEERAMHLQVRERASAAPSALTQAEPAFTYLCAERHGPRDTLTAHATDVETLGVGVFGEHTAQVLALQERFAVDSGRHAPQDKHIGALRFLTRQTELWLSRILGTAGSLRIEARWIEGTTVTTLRFQMPGQQAEWTRPQNVGFGVSYALPIVVAGLRAPKGGLLVVENPEAHLHPAGQSVMGAFLAQVAASGVQVVVETHSDHVINGVRRAVAERAVTLDPDAVAVLYFRPDAPGGHDRIQLRETGELSAWPAGFFDQLEQDLGAIARARRGQSAAMMRAYLDEAGLRFHGAPSETLRDAIDDLVDVLDDVREFDDEVVLWSDAAYDAEVDDDTTFMDFLFTAGDATLADARRRLMLAVNRLTSWETPDWELDVPDHDVHLAGEKVWAPSLAQAVTAESALGPIAVLALSTAREPGPTTVVLTDQAAILHTVTAPTGRRAFVRTWLQARPPAPVDFPCWLDRAFPDLRWTDEAQNGLRTNSKYFFGDRFPTTVHHLGVLNDHAADVFVEQKQNDLREKHLSALDVNASPESPNTRANRKAVEQRQVEWQGQTIAFWWHTKIRYDTGRIHFHHDASAPAPGRIVIGLCVEHLLV